MVSIISTLARFLLALVVISILAGVLGAAVGRWLTGSSADLYPFSEDLDTKEK
jgi:hypothetical protein